MSYFKDLKDFKDKYKPEGKKSKLEEYIVEIFDLRSAGYSFEQIRDYLIKYKKVKVSKSTIGEYYKRYAQKIKEEEEEKCRNKRAGLIFRLLNALEQIKVTSNGEEQIKEQIKELISDELALIL